MTTATPETITPLAWFQLLYAGAMPPDGYAEFRAFGTDRRMRERKWMQWPAWDGSGREVRFGPKTIASHQIYYGVALRKTDQDGTRLNCHPSHLLHLELDLRGTIYVDDDPKVLPPDVLRAACEQMLNDTLVRLEDLTLKPRAIVYSGHGLHVILARRISSDLADTEAINRWLAEQFKDLGADPDVFDASRILRLPGTLNLKNSTRPLRVEIWLEDASAVTPEEVLARAAAPERTPGTSFRGQKEIKARDREAILTRWRELRAGTSSGPGRHTLALAVSGWLKGNGWAETATVGLVAELAREADDEEVPDRVRAARDTYRREDAAVKGWGSLKDDFRLELEGLELEPLRTVPVMSGEGERPNGRTRKKINARPTYADLRDVYTEHLAETGQYIAYNEQNQTWWLYRNGVYIQMDTDEIRRRVDRALEDAGYDDIGNGTLESILAKISRVDGIWRPRPDLGPRELNCANGLLNLETLELAPHTPDRFITMQTAAAWDADAESSTWRDFMNATLATENQMTLGQFFGYCLTADTQYQAALLMIGKGGTGKGTTANVLQALLGGDTGASLSAAMSLESLKDGTPLLEPLVGKRLLVVSETLKEVDWLAFKRVTGEDRVMVNPKHRTPYFTRLVCKILIMSNVIPRLGDDATNDSLTRRFVPLEFNKQPTERTPDLLVKLTQPESLSGVLRWAVWCLHELWGNHGFFEPEGGLKRQIVQESNRVIAFLEESCQRCDLTDGTKVRDLYEAYNRWSGNSGYRPVGIDEFGKRLDAGCDFLGWPLERKQSRVTGASAKTVLGVKLRGLTGVLP